MKRFLLVFGLMIALTIRAQAWIYVAWGAGAGFYFTVDPFTGILAPDASGNQTIAQLIWSADAVADTVDASTVNYVTGDDVWLATFVLTEGVGGTTQWANFAPQTYSEGTHDHDAGFLYARIFQDATPANGEVYYASTPVANGNVNPTNVPPLTAQTLEMNSDLVNGNELNLTMIPEPGTLGLLGLGIMAIGGRCLRRKQQK